MPTQSTLTSADGAVTGYDATRPLYVAGAASEAHIGEVGNNQITIPFTQTVTASSAYASGNCIGGKITFSNAARVSGGSGLIQSAVVNIKTTQTGPMDLILFSADPSASTITDKTALSIAAADFDKVLGVIHITDYTSGGTPTTFQAQNQAMPFALSSGSTLYGALVTRATPTFGSTSDVAGAIRVIRN